MWFFYRNTRLLILIICLILMWGISSWQILPRMEDAVSSQWVAVITTRLPGASAYRVESLVTDIIEQELSEIDEIQTLVSSSDLGKSTIRIKLKNRVKNHDKRPPQSLGFRSRTDNDDDDNDDETNNPIIFN